MPRRFDYEHVETIRRRKRLQVQTLSERLGYSVHTMVSKMLAGDVTPAPEQIPAWADALGVDIDEVFPLLDDDDNPVEPDLQDLRCNKGIRWKAVPGIIGAASALPVRKAEKGELKNPLAEEYAKRLAKEYGVTLADLRAAEARSKASAKNRPGTGEDTTAGGAPAPADGAQRGGPVSLAETITHHLERMPAHARPTDADIAAAINVKAGTQLIVPAQVLALRTGATSQEEILTQVPEAILHQGLADVLGVPAITFQSSHEMVDHIFEYVHGLAERGDFELQARGGSGISPRFAAKLKELLAEVKAEGRGPKRGR